MPFNGEILQHTRSKKMKDCLISMNSDVHDGRKKEPPPTQNIKPYKKE